MKLKPSFRFFLSLTGSCFLLASQAHATLFYWDTNSTASGLGNTAGTWGAGAAGSAFLHSFANSDYRGILNGTLSTATGTTASGDYIFFGLASQALGNSGSTIGIASGGVATSFIVFGASQGGQGVTLSGGGGTITLGTTPNIVANNTGINTIGAVLAGTAGLTLSGPGTVTLTGAATYTGTTILNKGGTLNIGDGTSGNLNNTTPSALTFNAGGGFFNVAGPANNSQSMGALTFSAGEGVVTSTAVGASSAATLTFASLSARTAGASGNFSLAVNTASTGGTPNKIVLTGATAGVLLDKGLFFNGSSYAAYDSGGFVRALNYATTGGDLNTVDADTITASKHVKLTTSPASRAGDTLLSLNLAGSGVNYTMSSGSLTVPAILKSGGGSVSTISGGTSVTTAGNAELFIRTDTTSDLLTINSAVTGFSGGLTKSGAGTLTLSGTDGYTGTTTINAGTLALSGGAALADAGAVVLANAPGGTLLLNANETIGNLSGGGFSGGNVNVQGNTLTLADNSSQTFSGQLIGVSSGGVTKTGTGTLTLPNRNSFAGTLTLNAGTLQLNLNNDGASSVCMVSSGGAINMANGTTVWFNPPIVGAGAWQPTLGQFGWQGTAGFPRPVEYGMGNAINVTSGTANLKFGDGVNINNTGWRFSGNVTGSSSGNAVLAILPEGNGDHSYTFTGILADGTGGTLGLNISNQVNVYTCLSGANTFTGPITLANTSTTNASYLVIGGERNVTGSAAGTGYIGGGNYSGAISISAFTIFDYLSSVDQILGGTISGAGSVLKEGSGTLTLSGANSYTGATTISSGTLSINSILNVSGGGSAVGAPTTAPNGTIGIGSGTTAGRLTYTGTGNTSDRVLNLAGTIGGATLDQSGTGLIKFTSALTATGAGIKTLTLQGSTAGTGEISGAIVDNSGTNTTKVSKQGTGTWTLSGTNTYTGTTTVGGGTLALGANGALPTDKAVSIGSATLDAATFTNLPGTLAITGSAAINLGSGGSLSFLASNAVTWTGTLNITGTFVSGASLQFGTSSGGLTPAQLASISAPGWTAFALDGSGFLTATPASGGFATWKTTNSAGAQTLANDHDGDGASNGIEYFLGGPNGNTTGFTPLPGVTNTGGTLSVTWVKGSGYAGVYGTDFVVETSSTLVAPWTPAALGAGPDQVVITGNNVIYTFPTGTTKFARLKVTGP